MVALVPSTPSPVTQPGSAHAPAPRQSDPDWRGTRPAVHGPPLLLDAHDRPGRVEPPRSRSSSCRHRTGRPDTGGCRACGRWRGHWTEIRCSGIPLNPVSATGSRANRVQITTEEVHLAPLVRDGLIEVWSDRAVLCTLS